VGIANDKGHYDWLFAGKMVADQPNLDLMIGGF